MRIQIMRLYTCIIYSAGYFFLFFFLLFNLIAKCATEKLLYTESVPHIQQNKLNKTAGDAN